MALLVAPASYKGTERGKALQALIRNLRAQQPDVVGLCECFDDDERDKIKQGLHNVYHDSIEGPDEDDFESDGGLLLLSKYPMVAKHQTIFRQCEGEDCLANKGVLHARIRVPGHPSEYDMFLSHLQNPSPEIPERIEESARDTVKRQLTHLASFVEANSSPLRPALLMGDLNTNATRPELYEDFKRRLDPGEDLWVTTGVHRLYPLGATSDGTKSFSSDSSPLSVNSPERHKAGSRIDYFVSWQGTSYWPTYADTNIVVWQSSPGRDISDHYGLKTQFVNVRELKVSVRKEIKRVAVALKGFRCLEETNEVGSDEVYFRLTCTTSVGARLEKRTTTIEDVDSGDQHTYGSPITIVLGDPGPWLDVSVWGWEEDDTSGDDYTGQRTLRFTHDELRTMIGRSTNRVLPLLTGDGGEYAMTVELTVDA
jgi:endonuclease/exonuclease/phosphatase family metal-dependent hydrolase